MLDLGLFCRSRLTPYVRTTGDNRSNFHLILVFQHLILSHEIVSPNDEVSFCDQVQVAKELTHAFRTFDLHPPLRMAELNLHGPIISLLGG